VPTEASPPRRPPAPVWRFLWRLLLGLAIFLAVGEAGARLMGLGHAYESDPDSYLRSADPDAVFSLKPGYRGFSEGAEVVINSQGLRDEEITVARPPETARILVLGDSVAFGPGVRAEETFPEQLEDMLNNMGGGRRYEVINAGVIGYNTVQERARLEQVGLHFDPHVVILTFVVNDLLDAFSIFDRQYQPTDAFGPAKKWLRRNSYLYRFGQNLSWRILDNWRRGPEQTDRPRPGQRVLEREAEIRRIAELSRQNGAGFVLALYPDNLDNRISPRAPGQAETIGEELHGFAARHGFALVDLTSALGDVRDPRARRMRLREDPHPSPAGHEAIAEALFQHLQAGGLLPQ
jgi:lysophospholipase L1-like esterase